MSPAQRAIHMARLPRSGYPICGAGSFNFRLPVQTANLPEVTCLRCISLIRQRLGNDEAIASVGGVPEHGQQGINGARVSNAATGARKAEPKPRRSDGLRGFSRVQT